VIVYGIQLKEIENNKEIATKLFTIILHNEREIFFFSSSSRYQFWVLANIFDEINDKLGESLQSLILKKRKKPSELYLLCV